MTTTTTNRVDLLRALADHIDRADVASDVLAEDISGISFDRWELSAIAVQVYYPHTVAAWVHSLNDVTATGHVSDDSIHLHIAGSRNDFAVSIIFVLSADRIPDLYAELMEQDLGSGTYDFLPITLPAALGGAV